MVDRIACFITCGYTEAGAMQMFFKRINNKYEYKQFLPNKTVKKKGYPKNISDGISGLSGEALLKKVYSIISKHTEEIALCKAIIIEDDLDGKFSKWTEQEIRAYKQSIVDTIHTKLKKRIPVFILYASPEIESWFIADWENSFEYLYVHSGIAADLEINAKLFFTHHLKHFIEKNILKEYIEDLENYGAFDGRYCKLSDQLIQAIQFDVKKYIEKLSGTNSNYVNQIRESKNLYYSKKLHGDKMLKNIAPENVAVRCRKYYRPVYIDLLNFDSYNKNI